MNKLVAEAGLTAKIKIDSAGTGHWHNGELADPRTRAAAEKRGLDLTHVARQFKAADLENFDLVVGMDRANLRQLKTMLGVRKKPVIALLRSFDPDAPPDADIPDPYAGDSDGFEHVLDLCEAACRGLLAHVRDKL